MMSACLCSTNRCEISLNCTCRLYIYRINFAMWLNVKSVVQGKREGTFHLFMKCDMQYYTFICPILFCEAVCLYSVFEITLM